MFLLAGAVNLVFLLSSFFMLMMTEQVVVEESLECACSAAYLTTDLPIQWT